MATLLERLDERIALNDDERMLLIQARALGWLRREMIESVGIDAARRLFTRMGYQAGAHDAGLARKVRSKASLKDMFVVGPQLHCLLGSGLAKAVRLEFDVGRGGHYGEFVWTGFDYLGEPTVADSPTPFAPSGWCGDGVTVSPSSNFGVSHAVGIR